MVTPEYVEIEAHHHMAVTGADRCFVVALFGGVSIRFFVVERDNDLIDEIVDAIREFWAFVQDGTRPTDTGVRDAKVITRLNSKIDPKTEVVDMRGDTEFLALVEKKDALSKKANSLKKEIDEIKTEISQRMDGVGSAVISDTKQYTWITVADKEQPAMIKKGYTYLGARKISEKKVQEQSSSKWSGRNGVRTTPSYEGWCDAARLKDTQITENNHECTSTNPRKRNPDRISQTHEFRTRLRRGRANR